MYIYLIMIICLKTALWSNGNIVTVLSCDISLAVGSILLCALIFAYNNNSSYTDAILSSVQHHSVLFSITQFCSASLSSVQHHSVLFSITQFCSASLSSVQHHSVLFSITQFCSAFSDSVLISSLSAELPNQH